MIALTIIFKEEAQRRDEIIRNHSPRYSDLIVDQGDEVSTQNNGLENSNIKNTNTDGLASASLILGTLSLLLIIAGVGGLLGIFIAGGSLISGVLSIDKINKSNNKLRGKGTAIAGLILGLISFMIYYLAIAILISLF